MLQVRGDPDLFRQFGECLVFNRDGVVVSDIVEVATGGNGALITVFLMTKVPVTTLAFVGAVPKYPAVVAHLELNHRI